MASNTLPEDIPSGRPAPTSCPLLEDAGTDVWVACCWRYFYPVARSIVGEHSLAEDALQTAWPKVLQSISGFRGGPTACRWVQTIVANSARDILRQRRRRGEVALMETQVEDLARDPAPDPEAQVDEQQLLQILREMVKRLPPPYREVVELRFEQELSTAETARRLDISLSSVATRLHRALSQLKRRMEARMRPKQPPNTPV